MLKVMSLNINYYGDRHGEWPVRRELIAQAIRQAQPHIIALQAVRQDPERDNGVNQATQLANLVPNYRNVYFYPASGTTEGGAEGSAIISRIRMVDNQSLPLTMIPDLEDTNRRAVVLARFDLRFAWFNVFSAHFSWLPEQAETNVKETIPFIDSFKGPALLMGDLNQTPESDCSTRLAQAGWTDAWAMLHPDEPGWTFEAGNLNKRIDYAWASYELAPLVKDIEIVATPQAPGGADLSDHLGLLVSLDLNT